MSYKQIRLCFEGLVRKLKLDGFIPVTRPGGNFLAIASQVLWMSHVLFQIEFNETKQCENETKPAGRGDMHDKDKKMGRTGDSIEGQEVKVLLPGGL